MSRGQPLVFDDDTVLGPMDMTGLERPFFFKLEREATADDRSGTG
ncbi:MAG: hypothetical protein QNJ07_02515 [Woeseiaceae bacterium]|nr:hypothetical protein [Woeseiaceae bacterium]